MVSPGRDVEADGCVVGGTVAEIRMGDRSVVLVEANAAGAEATAGALQKAGTDYVVVVSEPDPRPSILAALRRN